MNKITLYTLFVILFYAAMPFVFNILAFVITLLTETVKGKRNDNSTRENSTQN